jgi:5-methylcytosine-specific restriction protein A
MLHIAEHDRKKLASYNLSIMYHETETWLIASNPSKYNIMGAFIANDAITWGLTVKTNVGDIIYIYLSAPYSRIKFKCIVDRIDVPVTERLGAEFWLEKFDPNRNLINLRLLSRLNDDRLQLKNLTGSKLMSSAPQGPRRLSEELNEFLSGL